MNGGDSPIARVQPREAAALIEADGYCYLDVRSPQEFIAGHPYGAYNIPIELRQAEGSFDNPEFLQAVQAHFALDARLVIGCRSGRRSLRAAAMLIGVGYSAIVEQRAGFEGTRDTFGGVVEPGWRALCLPWSADALPGRSWDALRQR